MRPLRVLLNCLRQTKGVTALEFALIAPFLCTFIVGIVDLSFGFQSQMAVTQAAQTGSYAAMLNGFNTSTISSAVANSTGTSGITASPAPTQSCGCPSGTAVTAGPCGSTCPDGQSSGTYITVNAQYQYSTMLAYPGFSSPMTLTATSMVRIK
ncbi:MAG TPA: TadE/TadG family type IV pilus assembly protein [Stellaceae bacterium]|nr:TadE/TadG family type IV pilus assembly protein [Stellaceae bacterium]